MDKYDPEGFRYHPNCHWWHRLILQDEMVAGGKSGCNGGLRLWSNQLPCHCWSYPSYCWCPPPELWRFCPCCSWYPCLFAVVLRCVPSPLVVSELLVAVWVKWSGQYTILVQLLCVNFPKNKIGWLRLPFRYMPITIVDYSCLVAFFRANTPVMVGSEDATPIQIWLHLDEI